MVRRGRNEGSISKRADGRWEARLTLADGNRKSFYGKTRKEVADRLREALHDLSKGLPIAPEKITVAQYLEVWLASSASHTRPSTQRRYQDIVRIYLVPTFGRKKLVALDAAMLQLFYRDLKEKHDLKPATIRLVHVVLKSSLNEAVNLDYLARNPAAKVKPPKVPRSSVQHPLNEEEAQRFQDAVIGHRLESLFILAVHTGMRLGELVALHWEDVNFDEGELLVAWTNQETRKDGKAAWELVPTTKTDNPHKIALSEIAMDALRAQATRQKAERFAVGPDWANAGLVFPDPAGEVLKEVSVWWKLKSVLKKANLPDIRFHDLRHTCATILLSRGVQVKLVSEMLGHKDIAMTLGVYGHVLPSMHRAAATMMDTIFKRRA